VRIHLSGTGVTLIDRFPPHFHSNSTDAGVKKNVSRAKLFVDRSDPNDPWVFRSKSTEVDFAFVARDPLPDLVNTHHLRVVAATPASTNSVVVDWPLCCIGSASPTHPPPARLRAKCDGHRQGPTST